MTSRLTQYLAKFSNPSSEKLLASISPHFANRTMKSKNILSLRPKEYQLPDHDYQSGDCYLYQHLGNADSKDPIIVIVIFTCLIV